jgi:hypothetical protein
MSIKIVSGGQAGVERAALDAAMEAGVACGGWCAEGRTAEDGRIPDRYPVCELAGAGYRTRVQQNVRDSDATLIIASGGPEDGTTKPARYCRFTKRPMILIDADTMEVEAAVTAVAEFIELHQVGVLNVAGPKASKRPGVYEYARRVVAGVVGGKREQTPRLRGI